MVVVLLGIVVVILAAWALAQFLSDSPIGRALGIIAVAVCAPIVWGVLFLFSWGTFAHDAHAPPAGALLFATAATAGLYWWIAKSRRRSREASLR
jgi:hypothetical protein